MSVLLTLHLIITVCLVIVILIQRSGADGMSGMGGGGAMGGMGLMSGRGTANLLTRMTAILAAAFMINALLMGYLVSHRDKQTLVDKIQQEGTPAELPAVPAETPQPQVPIAQ